MRNANESRIGLLLRTQRTLPDEINCRAKGIRLGHALLVGTPSSGGSLAISQFQSRKIDDISKIVHLPRTVNIYIRR